jgi:hypothetical protein
LGGGRGIVARARPRHANVSLRALPAVVARPWAVLMGEIGQVTAGGFLQVRLRVVVVRRRQGRLVEAVRIRELRGLEGGKRLGSQREGLCDGSL